MEYRTCTQCGEEFPATEEFFYKQKAGKFGLKAECKVCSSTHVKKWYKNNREKRSEVMKKYYEVNKERSATRMAEWYENNREKIIVKDAKYYENNKERILTRRAEYYIDNKEKITIREAEYRKNNREKVAICTAKWAKNNPEKIAVNTARRRAKKLNQTPILTQDEKHQIDLIYKKSQELGSGWQVDHLIPLSKGGLHHPDNLQIVTKDYNLQKNDKIGFRPPTDKEIFNWN